MRKLLILIALLGGTIFGAGALTPETVTFGVVGGDTLRMDVYRPEKAYAPTPVVLFAFGGGFVGGHRDNPEYLPYFHFLAEHGITVCSADYRTSLAQASPKTPQEFASALGGAITDAVADFYLATGYLLANAGTLHINPSKIIASGSSAGAITALQAEYGLCNGAPSGLPEGFNFAGVVSFAGAICTAGPLVWQWAPAPMLLFHGDADSNVPYGTLTEGSLSLNGSSTIASSLTETGVPNTFFTYQGFDHVVAISPMHDNLYDIYGFISGTILGESRNITAINSHPAGTHPAEPKKFTLVDFIRANGFK